MSGRTTNTVDGSRQIQRTAVNGALGTRSIVADDGEVHAFAGGETVVAAPADPGDAVEIEGSAAEESPAGGRRAAVRTWLFQTEQAPRAFPLPELPRIVSADRNFAWIDLDEYTAEDLRRVAGMLELHPAGVRGTLSRWQRPRLDAHGDQCYVTVTVPRIDVTGYRVEAGQLDLFVGRNFLVSAHKHPLPFGGRVEARARQSPQLVGLDSAFMLYIVLDELVEYYEGLGERVQVEIERMEERALRDTSDAFLGDLLQFKRFAFALSRLADQHREVFAAFLRPDFTFVSGDETEPYFRDLQERLARLLDQSLAAREAVNGAFDIYVSQMSHRTNQIMKILTIVSTALLPASVILALFSASFEGLPNYGPVALVAMIATTVVFTMAITLAIRRRGWL